VSARAWQRGAGAVAILFGLALAGCNSNRVDQPPDAESVGLDVPPSVDSLATWAARARTYWASGDSMLADDAGALAREAFAAAWVATSGERSDAAAAEGAERLPLATKGGAPLPASVAAALARVGLSADILVAEGGTTLWQVIVSDPVGSAGSATEFWAWPDANSAEDAPRLQTLPPKAPARTHYGPEAVGQLFTYARAGGAGLSSAWSRPRGRGGLEVALAERGKTGYRVTNNRVLPIGVDSVQFTPAAGGGPPALVVVGAGERDPHFDDCPTCPHLERHQRYVFQKDNWSLVEERVKPTPYAALVAFVHELSTGTPDGALPYATDMDVVEQARSLGIDQGFRGFLRAAPGTGPDDVTQRYRTVGSEGIEVTFEQRGDRFVISDLRAARIVIE
jgi:hypothetical protein